MRILQREEGAREERRPEVRLQHSHLPNDVPAGGARARVNPEIQPLPKLSSLDPAKLYPYRVAPDGDNYVVSRHVDTKTGEGWAFVASYSTESLAIRQAMVFRSKYPYPAA